jgi:recombination protein RecA
MQGTQLQKSNMLSAKLQESLSKIQKKYGDESIMRYGDTPDEAIEVIPTGIPSLDVALGIGGIPKGRMIEIAGPESSGKTTCALHMVAEAQRQGGMVAFIDAEHALDPHYAQSLGVDMDNILISQPDSGEIGLEIVEQLVRSGEVTLIVVDSVAALATQAELNGEMSDATVAGIPRLLSKALRKLVGITSKENCTVVFINQMRANIGGYGNAPTEITTGGKALRYYTSIRLDIRRIGAVKGSGEDVVGQKTRIKVIKNKLAAPHKECNVDLIYGEGFSKESDLLDIAIEKGVILKKGGWFAYGDKNIAQGRENARIALKDKAFYDEVYDKVNTEK